MGAARARGNYEERKALAIAAGRVKKDAPARPTASDPRALGVAFLNWWRSQMTPVKPSKSWTKFRAKRKAAKKAA